MRGVDKMAIRIPQAWSHLVNDAVQFSPGIPGISYIRCDKRGSNTIDAPTFFTMQNNRIFIVPKQPMGLKMNMTCMVCDQLRKATVHRRVLPFSVPHRVTFSVTSEWSVSDACIAPADASADAPWSGHQMRLGLHVLYA